MGEKDKEVEVEEKKQKKHRKGKNKAKSVTEGEEAATVPEEDDLDSVEQFTLYSKILKVLRMNQTLSAHK